jgi:hypothetical protein
MCECERGDLNPYGVNRWILSPVRLPVPPLSHEFFLPPKWTDIKHNRTGKR